MHWHLHAYTCKYMHSNRDSAIGAKVCSQARHISTAGKSQPAIQSRFTLAGPLGHGRARGRAYWQSASHGASDWQSASHGSPRALGPA